MIEAIKDGTNGKIAVTYFEWAGYDLAPRHRAVDDHRHRAETPKRFAAKLSAMPPNSARRTSISSALEFAADLFAESSFRGLKRVIDVSGDGPTTRGLPVVAARDDVIAQGITINGLPLMTNGGPSSAFDIDDLDMYYTDCVIGGPGAFMVPVNDWTQFPEAIRRKLVLELAGRAPVGRRAPPLVQARPTPIDCLIGEKMWRDRSWMWDNLDGQFLQTGDRARPLGRDFCAQAASSCLRSIRSCCGERA